MKKSLLSIIMALIAIIIPMRSMAQDAYNALETPLTFEAVSGTVTVTINNYYCSNTPTIQYRIDGGNWTDFTLSHTECYGEPRYANALPAGKIIEIRADKWWFNSTQPHNDCLDIACDADCYVYGNVLSITREDYATNYETADYLSFLFYNNTHIINHPDKALVLPSTKLYDYCYQGMFQGCTGLTSSPELPAPDLNVEGCYKNMFNGCSNLSTVTCHATSITGADATTGWLEGVAQTGTFIKPAEMTGWKSGPDGIPVGWNTSGDNNTVTEIPRSDKYYIIGEINNWTNDNVIKTMFYRDGKNDNFTYTTKWGTHDNLSPSLLLWDTRSIGVWDWNTAWGVAGNGEPSSAPNGTLALNTSSNHLMAPESDAFYTLSFNMKDKTYEWTRLEDQQPTEYQSVSMTYMQDGKPIEVDMSQVTPHNWFVQHTFSSNTYSTYILFRANHENATTWGSGNNHLYYIQGKKGTDSTYVSTNYYNRDMYFYLNDITGQINIVPVNEFSVLTEENVEITLRKTSDTSCMLRGGYDYLYAPAVMEDTEGSVTIPSEANGLKVTSIPGYAFTRCSMLTNITIPESVTSISNYAFSGCSSLKEMYIPASVISMGDGMFSKCSSLERIVVAEDNPYYDSRNNCNAVMRKSDNKLLAGCKNSVIPEETTAFGYDAFYGMTMTEIVIPENVTDYGFESFEKCDNLVKVTVLRKEPASIGNDMFSNQAYRNATLYVPAESVEAYKAAEGWKQFQKIRGIGETEAEPYAVLSDNNTVLTFYYDENKQQRNGMDVRPFGWVGSGDNSHINSGWYEQRESITNVVFDESFSNYTSLESTNYWFWGCVNLMTITGISNLKTNNVKNMISMFANCSKLTSLDLTGFNTQNVTNMSSMFENCSSLTSIDVNNFKTEHVTTMELMFSNCSSLISLDVSKFNTDNLTDMFGMFRGCSSLTSLDVSGFKTDNVQRMTWMFISCNSLASIQAGSASIPAEQYAEIGNPNLLVYVNEASLAPQGVQNVVINGQAKEIILTDAESGYGNWYCPQAFTAEKISYTREFKQNTEVGISRGWESIALPFNVQTITHENQGQIIPFTTQGNGKKFWLRGYSPDGLYSAPSIEANTPYLISMPNNTVVYPDEYNLNGRVTFTASNTTVPATPKQEEMIILRGNIAMMPNFLYIPQNEYVYAINVGQPRENYAEGSVFARGLRDIRPFEAYTSHAEVNGARPNYIRIGAQPRNETMGIKDIELDNGEGSWYDLNGRKLSAEPKAKGVYIHNGKKTVVR